MTPTVITESNKDGIYSRIPGKTAQDSFGCLECALREASLMAGDSEGTRTKVILMSASNVEDNAEIKKSLKSLTRKSEVMMMMMGNQWMLDEESDNLKIFNVDKTEQKSVSDLFDILSLTLSDKTDANQNVKFFSAEFLVGSNQRVSGKFVVENNLQENMFVMTSSVMQEDIEVFQLTSPSGSIYNFPILDKGQAYFQFSGSAETGVWSYNVKLTPNTIQPRVPVFVAAYAGPAPSHPAISVEGWTATEKSGNENDDKSPRPVIIYARVTDNEMPVLDAEVVAHVSRPDGDSLDIVLHDSGTGYPDLDTGDGVYSAYFTEFSQLAGFYGVTIEVRNHEGRASVASLPEELTGHVCGSPVSSIHSIPSLHFTRFIRIPSFFLSQGVRYSIKDGVPVRKDVYPPARITDLRVSGRWSDVELELSWTATGDDLDSGVSSNYEIRWSENRQRLIDAFSEANILNGVDLSVPGQYGSLESFNFTVAKVNTQLYFAIVARDEAGNTSPVSNILPVYAREEIVTSTEDAKLSHVSSLTLPEMSSTAWVYILSISLATVSLIIIMLLLIIIRRRRMRKLQENCPIPYFIELGPPTHHHTEKAERQLVPSTDTTRDYPDDTLSYPASPVKAHPVLELYQHHARQYQMYQQQSQPQSESCRSSSSSSDTGSSDKNSDRESPSSWQRQYRRDNHESVVSNQSDSQSSSASSSHRQSRRRRESFV